MLLMVFVFTNQLAVDWFTGGYWGIFILSPLAFSLLVIMTACFIRRSEDKNTMMRHMNLFKALKKAEGDFLGETGIQLMPGEYGSWIEIIYREYNSD